MRSHPVNLALRFLLELAALLAFGVWGWQKSDGWLRFVLALGIPIIVTLLWATFHVPNDPGPAPIAIPGIFRLAFELALFALATWALYDVRLTPLSWILGVVVVIHYIASYDRMVWLIASSHCAVQPVLGADRLRRGYTRCVLPAIALVIVASLTRVGGG